jgi:hypothetical protein
MRRLGTLCLLFGLAAPALAVDEPPPAEEPSIPWYRWLFLGERSKPTPPRTEPASAPAPATPAARDRAPAGPPSKEAAARTLEQEKAVYIQRLLAITRIRELAVEQNDEPMLQRAEEMEQQATDIYNQRTARLTAKGTAPDDRAALERGRDDRPAAAQRPAPRRRTTTGGTDR